MSKQALPLEGIVVIDYTHFLAGPYLSRCLASMGADVIKVERPITGDAGRAHPYFIKGQSGYFLQQNMGKRGLCLDVKDPRGLELLQRLVRRADVFVENYRPGTLERLSLGYEKLAQLNPSLIYCSVSAYGHTGVDSGRPGFGVMAEARSGAMDLIGNKGEIPPLFRMPIADMYAGIHGVAAVCAALFGRRVADEGQHIDIALYDCMVSMHDYAVQFHTLSGGTELVERSGHTQPQSTVYGVFPARDGPLVIAAQVDETWKRLARLVGGDQLANDTRFHTAESRNAHSQEAVARVGAWTQPRTVKECLRALDAAEIPCAPIQRIDQVLADPQLAARGMIVEQHHPVLGPIRMPNVPFKFSASGLSVPRVAPSLGQHNREIAASLGYSSAAIDTLERDRVLYAELPVAEPA